VVVDVLVERSLRCCHDQNQSTLVMVGGVAANARLREQMERQGRERGIAIHLAPLAFCTDNAAMVGAAALGRLQSGWNSSSLKLGVSARWPLESGEELYSKEPRF